MGSKNRTKRSKSKTKKRAYAKRPRVGTMRSFSALAPPRYEKKFLDTDINASMKFFSTNGIVQNDFTLISTGAANGQRVGSQVTVTNINAHIDVTTGTNSGSPGLGNTVVRVILGIDKQCNGANTAVTDVLQTASPNSFRNMFTLNRFIILKDKVFTLNPQVWASTPNVSEVGRYLKFAWKGQLPILYAAQAGGSTVIGEVKSNNIFLLVISDRDGYSAGVSPTIDGCAGKVRIKYTDA